MKAVELAKSYNPKDFEEIGFKRNGAYAEYIDVPVYGLILRKGISESISEDCRAFF